MNDLSYYAILPGYYPTTAGQRNEATFKKLSLPYTSECFNGRDSSTSGAYLRALENYYIGTPAQKPTYKSQALKAGSSILAAAGLWWRRAVVALKSIVHI